MAEVAERAKQISIHAPTRGATITDAFSLMMELFQSTLLQEERRRIACPADHYSYFNPRSYKRSDLHSALALSKICYFNPRSYKRSDVRPELPEPFPCYFNPRSYKRSDLNLCCIINCYKYFNPRSYKRSDCEETSNSFHDDYFNPRSYKRSDCICFFSFLNKITISIHAPTRGATSLQNRPNHFHVISIHAPTRGATFCTSIVCPDVFYFNPRSYKRSDPR